MPSSSSSSAAVADSPAADEADEEDEEDLWLGAPAPALEPADEEEAETPRPTTARALGPATVRGDPFADSMTSPRLARLMAVPGVVGNREYAPPGRALRIAPATTPLLDDLDAPGVLGAARPAAAAPFPIRDFCARANCNEADRILTALAFGENHEFNGVLLTLLT